MGNFRSNDKEGFRGRSGNRRFGDRGRSRFGDYGGERSFGRDFKGERRPLEMHKAICAKCKKECEVPFKPTSNKPVYCSDCFKTEGNSGSRGNSKGNVHPGISAEQFNQLNVKLDKILAFIKTIEVKGNASAKPELR